MNIEIIKHFRSILIVLSILFTLTVFTTSVIYANDEVSNESTSNNEIMTSDVPNYTIKIFDSSVGADVEKNPEIKNNIPQTSLSKKIIKYQKNGSILIKFGNGKGKKLLIWAGIHGNEEEANIAAMKYIEYLKNKNFNGTIYIVPFAMPKSTALNSRSYNRIKYTYTVSVRYKKWFKKLYHVRVKKWFKLFYRSQGILKYRWKFRWIYKTVYRKKFKWQIKKVKKTGYKKGDPNRMANIPGTPGWKAVEFAKKNGISYIIDVHSGIGLESHSKGLVYATPGWIQESKWANYIKSKVGSSVGIGNGHPGMVNVYGNKRGINTITLEVERDKGSTRYWAEIEFSMIKAACKYLFPQL